MTRTKLEQCASVLTSFNGPNFAFRLPDGGLPDDTNFPSGNTQNVTKLELARGAQFAGSVQAMLQALWPYPVCSPRGQSDCTTFPLPVPARDPDGGLNASLGCLKPPYRHTDNVNCSTNTSVDLSFLSLNSGNGVIDYHCTWAVLHTLSFNGGAVLTAAEKRAFGELVMYISGQFDCKVCRNNFVEIIRHFGLPTGSVREEYARWLWQAHNNANEHSYATHSINVNMAANEYPGQDAFKHTRTPEWSHPKHEHPWYMTFERAASVWTGLERGVSGV